MRKPFLAGNWKMHLGAREAVALAEEIRDEITALIGEELTARGQAVSRGHSVHIGLGVTSPARPVRKEPSTPYT